jgi:hypothetical protein
VEEEVEAEVAEVQEVGRQAPVLALLEDQARVEVDVEGRDELRAGGRAAVWAGA